MSGAGPISRVSSYWARCRKRGEISGNILDVLRIGWLDAEPNEADWWQSLTGFG